MTELTQQEKLSREEEQIEALIQDLKYEISLYEEDLVILRKHLTDLKEGENSNAWQAYTEIMLRESHCWRTRAACA